MNIDSILEFIACPNCEGSLRPRGNSALICQKCRNTYRVVEGIPVLMDSSKFNNQEKKQQRWFESHYAGFSKEKYSLENWRESMLKRILEVDFPKHIKTYLDIGCGATGYTTIEAAKRKDWLSFGVDISLEAMVRAKIFAEKRGVSSKTAFIVCSAERLPFKPKTFDYISALSVLEHLEHDDEIVKGAAKTLTEDGLFFLCVPNTYRRMWPFLWPVYFIIDKKIGHKRHYSIEGLDQKMAKSGFIRKEVFYNGHLIKLIQLVMEKIKEIDELAWWKMEEKDMNTNSLALQLNAIYRKK